MPCIYILQTKSNSRCFWWTWTGHSAIKGQERERERDHVKASLFQLQRYGFWHLLHSGENVQDAEEFWKSTIFYYSDWIRAGRSGIEFQWGRDFPPVQTGPGAHTASCTMSTGSFPGVKCGWGLLLTTHPLLVPWSRKSRAIPLPIFWATPGL
jgi:hypothetical protein